MANSLLKSVKPTRRIDSVLYQSIDHTAISMSLAEGLVKRLRREMIDGTAGFFRDMRKTDVSSKGKSSKRLSAVKTAAANNGLVTYELDTEAGSCVVVVRWSEERFKILTYHADRKGFRCLEDYASLTLHAVARYIYRSRCVNFHELFKDFIYTLQTAAHKAIGKAVGDEYPVVMDKGIGIYKVQPDNETICVTWIDADKVRPEQSTTEPYLDILERSAKIRGITLMACYGFSEHEINKAYLRYGVNGGTGTVTEFANSKTECAELINKLIGAPAIPFTADMR